MQRLYVAAHASHFAPVQELRQRVHVESQLVPQADPGGAGSLSSLTTESLASA